MGRFISTADFIAQFGEAEARQIAGTGDFNTPEGSQINLAEIEGEIAFADELIAGYVLSRHPWVGEQEVADVPNLLKGLAGDIVRYRLRDKNAGTGQVSKTVETRYSEAFKRLEQIQRGTLDLPRDRRDGSDLASIELPESVNDTARISGPASSAASILEGY